MTLLEKNFDVPQEVSNPYGITGNERHRAAEAAMALIDTITKDYDPLVVADLGKLIQASFGRLGENLYNDVNGHRKPNYFFSDGLYHQWRTRANSGAIHLELGTWIAWPDERAASYVAQEGIGDIIRLDMQAEFQPDVAASVTALPFKDGTIDRIASNSLFEHVAYPHEILRETYRVLRPGGILYTAVPFHFVQHDCPNDYLRFTGTFFEHVCKEMGFTEVFSDTKSTSGVYYTIHNLAKGALVSSSVEGPMKALLQELHLAVLALLGACQASDDFMIAEGQSHFHSTIFYAIKGGAYQPSTQFIDRSKPFLDRHRDLLICPRTWEPLHRSGNKMVSTSGQSSYDISGVVPNLFVLHGKNSVEELLLENARLAKENASLRGAGIAVVA